jgi:hypothetical protein
VAAGATKAARPYNTALALSQLGRGPARHVPATAVRVAAVMEVALGTAALAWPARLLAAAVGLSYGAFAGFATLARWRGGAVATCGCFGEPDTPASVVHMVLDAAFLAAASAVAVAAPTGTTAAVLARQYADGLPLAAASVLAAWLAFLAMGPLARLAVLRAATREVGR